MKCTCRSITDASDCIPPFKAKELLSVKTFAIKALDVVGFMDKPIPKPGPDDAALLWYLSIVLVACFTIA